MNDVVLEGIAPLRGIEPGELGGSRVARSRSAAWPIPRGGGGDRLPALGCVLVHDGPVVNVTGGLITY